MGRMLDLNSSVYQLTEEYPEIIEVLGELGFTAIRNPVVRKTAGKKMTIPAGCKLQKIPLERVIERLRQAGFSIEGSGKDE